MGFLGTIFDVVGTIAILIVMLIAFAGWWLFRVVDEVCEVEGPPDSCLGGQPEPVVSVENKKFAVSDRSGNLFCDNAVKDRFDKTDFWAVHQSRLERMFGTNDPSVN
jgi:hypothetical protein